MCRGGEFVWRGNRIHKDSVCFSALPFSSRGDRHRHFEELYFSPSYKAQIRYADDLMRAIICQDGGCDTAALPITHVRAELHRVGQASRGVILAADIQCAEVHAIGLTFKLRLWLPERA